MEFDGEAVADIDLLIGEFGRDAHRVGGGAFVVRVGQVVVDAARHGAHGCGGGGMAISYTRKNVLMFYQLYNV